MSQDTAPKPSAAPRDEQQPFASWWRPLSRREFSEGTLALAAVATLAGVESGCLFCPSRSKKPPEQEKAMDSLSLQKQEGWNIGKKTRPLRLFGAVGVDSTGSPNWTNYLKPQALMAAVTPVASDWKPFFVPTLIQSLAQPSLAKQMKPINNRRMHEAKARGKAIAKTLLPAAEKANTTLIVVDLPGPEAVAMAAGMSETMNVVFTFDNWPHPIGVVRSHQTLAALLFYAAEIEKNKANLKEDAATAVILDADRLSPFSSPDIQFDNRYMAKMPEPDALTKRDIKNVLYVTPSRAVQREKDDLNELFVDYKKADLQVAILPASDLQRAAEPTKRTIQTEAGPREVVEYHYYYGGHPHTHFHFFAFYPFWVYRPAYIMRTGMRYRGPVRAPSFSRPAYRPVARPTAFAGQRMAAARGGVGRARPSGFGRTSVRTSGGRVTGVRAGRSGSYGRSYSRGGYSGSRSRGGSSRGGFFG